MYAIEHAYPAGINYRLYAKNLYFRMGHRPKQDAPKCWVKETPVGGKAERRYKRADLMPLLRQESGKRLVNP
jgi:hypothetical protein